MILFSMTTIPQRAPHIAPVLGSLLAHPGAHIMITAPKRTLSLVPIINDTRIHLVPCDESRDTPTNKWTAVPPEWMRPDVISSCDDDFIYSVSDIESMVKHVKDDSLHSNVYQARDAANVFNAYLKPKPFTGFKEIRHSEMVYGGYLVGMHPIIWGNLRRQLLAEWDTLSEDEHLADDYTVARILTELGIRINALPIRPGFPGCEPMAYNKLGALSHRDGGNMNRYMKLAKMHKEQGNPWWLKCR